MEYMGECRYEPPKRSPDKDRCYNKEEPYDQGEREVSRLMHEQDKYLATLNAALEELQNRLSPLLGDEPPETAREGEVGRSVNTDLGRAIYANSHQVAICTAWVRSLAERLGI